MVALHLPQPEPHDWSSSPLTAPPARRRPVGTDPGGRDAPGPGRRSRPSAPVVVDRGTVYRRRRLAVLVLGALLVLGVVAAGQYLTSLGQGGASAPIDAGPASGPAPVNGPAPGDVYVVQPGDTLWSIAAAVAPDVDPRAVVDRLQAATGDDELEPGQRLVLDVD